MSAEALFVSGGARVLDREGGATVGFVWVEPAPGPGGYLGGQIQRWVLTRLPAPADQLLTTYVFEPWDTAPGDLDTWSEVVRMPLREGAEWGKAPKADGLWPRSDGALYVVAQSSVASQGSDGALTFLPEPVYPRRDAVKEHAATFRVGRPPVRAVANPPKAPPGIAQKDHAVPAKPLATPGRPTGQVIDPLMELHQWELGSNVTPAYVGFGGGEVEPFTGRTFFEGQELFLLHPNYRRAGGEKLVTRWREKKDPEVTNLTQLRSRVVSTIDVEHRCEVVGCNYYQDTTPGFEPPPQWFV